MSNSGDKTVERREFLATGVASIATASLCGGCSMFTSKIRPDSQLTVTDGALIVDKSLRPQLAQPGGVVRLATADGHRRVLVVRQANGNLAALNMACTHWGSDVKYDAQKAHFRCPTHGSRFALDGKVLEGPADEPLKTYVVKETETEIRVIL